jgi:hypothetical protein
MTLELLFDGYEDGNGGLPNGGTVAQSVAALNEMAQVQDPRSPTADKRRPHHCVVVWGVLVQRDTFQCVITSIQTKYTMMKSDGTPLRATCTVKVKEATRVMMSKDSSKNAPDSSSSRGTR